MDQPRNLLKNNNMPFNRVGMLIFSQKSIDKEIVYIVTSITHTA
jgi:hypothetical protein